MVLGQLGQRVGTPPSVPDADPPTSPALIPRLFGALVAGIGLAFAFAPIGWAWLIPPAVGALTLLCRGLRARHGALVGFVFGLAFFLVLVRWLTVIGIDALIALAVLQAVFLAALGAALSVLTTLRGWPVWASAGWVGIELARSHLPLGGFGWGKLAFGLDETPLASYIALGGAPLVTFIAAVTGNLLAWALVTSGRGTHRLASVGAAGVLVGAGLLVPLPTGANAPSGSGDSGDDLTAAVVQGNIPSSGMDFLGRARTVTRYHLEATRELMADVDRGAVERPEVILWPENSTDLNPRTDEPTGELVDEAAELAGVPLLIGSTQDGPDPRTRYNTSVLYEADADPRTVYRKRHPVPFGEYIPFRGVLTRFIDRLELIPRDMVGGDEPGVFDFGPARAGIVICFEVAWDGLVRDAASDGSQLLLVQTNNATYLGTGQLEQQFAATRMRAIEHGKTVLIASTSGISAVVAPDGEVIAKSGEMTREVFVEQVPLRSEPTLATVVGAWPEWIIAGIGLLALGAGVRTRRRTQSAAGSAAGSAVGAR